MYLAAADPFSPAGVDDGSFGQWTSKEKCGEERDPCYAEQRDWVPS